MRAILELAGTHAVQRGQDSLPRFVCDTGFHTQPQSLYRDRHESIFIEAVYILARLNELQGVVIELLIVIGCEEEPIIPIKAQPPNVSRIAST